MFSHLYVCNFYKFLYFLNISQFVLLVNSKDTHFVTSTSFYIFVYFLYISICCLATSFQLVFLANSRDAFPKDS